MNGLTHFDDTGAAHMVDVGSKSVTARMAVAEGFIYMMDTTLAMVQAGNHKKGDVLGIARVAGIMACKRTADLIPLCHPIPLTHVSVQLFAQPEHHRIRCEVKAETQGVTGVEMEALTGVQIALLTIYDMCKAVDRGMTMDGIKLLEKHGGKSGSWIAAAHE